MWKYFVDVHNAGVEYTSTKCPRKHRVGPSGEEEKNNKHLKLYTERTAVCCNE